MVTEKQAQLEYAAAYDLEDAIANGKWKGISKDDLCIIESHPGVFIEVSLDRHIKGLKLMGIPDFSDDGKYLIQLVMEKDTICPDRKKIQKAAPQLEPSAHPLVICDALIKNDRIYVNFKDVLDNLLNDK